MSASCPRDGRRQAEGDGWMTHSELVVVRGLDGAGGGEGSNDLDGLVELSLHIDDEREGGVE